jgi:HlyD family secretion protein
MKNFLIKIKSYVVAHKIISAIMIVAILGVGYWGYNKITSTTGETQYITTTVKKGTIVSSVTESGQIESSDQINLTPKVSGTVTYVGVKAGDKVKKGQTLFAIDNTSAKKTVRDAEISLQNAQLALQKLQLQNSSTSLDTSLKQSYDSGFNTASVSLNDINGTLNGLQTLLLTKQDLSDSTVRAKGQIARNYQQTALTEYYAAKTAYDKNNTDYGTLSNTSPASDIKNIVAETYDTTKLLSQALKGSADFVNYMAEDSSGNISSFTAYQSTIATYATTTNNDLSNLLTAQTNITSSENALPTNDLNTQSAQISVTQAQNSLQDAKDNLANYYVTAPFSGTIASVSVEVGDTASGTIASLITSQEVATLSLNEVDVAKIKLGEKTTVSFDAISDLTMTGTVAEIDTVGTVSSGVVTYTVKIAFDTENDLIKPGMSVSAAIITDSQTDALIVPSSAIKTQGTTKYVQMFTTPLAAPAAGSRGTPSKVAPNKVTVEVGISDDTNTEILSGLKEGDQIVSSTITSTTATKSTSTTTKSTSATSLLSGSRGGPGM